MTSKSFRGLERDLDAMISAANSVATSSNCADRDAAAKRVREHRDAVFARVNRLVKNAWQKGTRDAKGKP